MIGYRLLGLVFQHGVHSVMHYEYRVTFAGSTVLIQYENDELSDFLALLFHDLRNASYCDYEKILKITHKENTARYALASEDETLFRGCLGVHFAAVLFDSVIFNLLNRNNKGVALHAGAVVYREKMILLPGRSGAGKSSLSAWLTAHNYSYLTDELVFLPENRSGQVMPFTRPFCIKSGAVPEIKKLIREEAFHDILEDEHGAVVPHRLLNSQFSKTTSFPALILFPQYQSGSSLKVEKVSGAQCCTSLMACDVNARNLKDHGFRHVVKIARSTPAYKIRYGSFSGMDVLVADLMNGLDQD